ncbi:PAS domain S-box-containing protein [Massilia sp. UYP11]|uniref:PAS domain-containing protein n=1 Tax=Massilia sp. UYP11 TaxID=1756385 RepID=UPI003D2310C7
MLTFSKTEHYHFDPSIVLELTTTFVCSFDGTILYWSEGCAHLYGWTASEVVGRNADDMLSTVLPIPLRELERELRCNGEWIGDVRQVKRCGSPVTTCIKTTLVSDTEGESSAFVHVVTDVTASRELEAQLRKSEATLSAVIDSLPVGLVIADPDGRVLRDNAANRKIWGVPPQTTSWEQYGEWEGYWPNTGKRIAPDEWAMSRALFKREIVHGELVECQPFNNGPRRFI